MCYENDKTCKIHTLNPNDLIITIQCPMFSIWCFNSIEWISMTNIGVIQMPVMNNMHELYSPLSHRAILDPWWSIFFFFLFFLPGSYVFYNVEYTMHTEAVAILIRIIYDIVTWQIQAIAAKSKWLIHGLALVNSFYLSNSWYERFRTYSCLYSNKK